MGSGIKSVMKIANYEAICQYQVKAWPQGKALSEIAQIEQSVEKSAEQSAEAIKITLPFVEHSLKQELMQEFELKEHELDIQHQVAKMQSLNSHISHPKIKNLIAVSSGKGGVGKSTIAAELALALKQLGAKVGILDADIHGPSQASLLGLENQQISSKDGKLMEPIETQGIVANSIAFLVAPDDATIWRGPMASKVLMQLYNETRWPELDYLIVDMPPGTSDIQLTLAQALPVTAAIVVSTPQNLALLDAQKGIAMFNNIHLPVLGVVENMSHFDCSCGKRHYPFGRQGVETLLEKNSLACLASLPIFADGQGRGHESYLHLAEQVAQSLWFKGREAPQAIEIVEVS